MAKKTCYNCGKEVKEDDTYCAQCGWQVTNKKPEPKKTAFKMPEIPTKKIIMAAGIIALIILLVFAAKYALTLTSTPTPIISANKTITCNQPYIPFEKGCCLDINGNKICDSEEKQTEENTTAVNETPVVKEPVIELSPTILDIQKKAKQRIAEGYSFILDGTQYWEKGNKTKIKLNQWVSQGTDEKLGYALKIDAVYLDNDKKTAIGDCEFSKKTDSGCYKQSGRTFNVTYAEYAKKMPSQYVLEITEAKVVNEKTQIQGTIEVTELRVDTENKKESIWVDRFLGLPLRVQIAKTGDATELHNIEKIARSVDDAEMTPPKQ